MVEKANDYLEKQVYFMEGVLMAQKSEQFYDVLLGQEKVVYIRIIDSLKNDVNKQSKYYKFISSKSEFYYALK